MYLATPSLLNYRIHERNPRRPPQELASRLSRYFGEAEAGLAPPAEGPFAVSYEDALPLDDFFEVEGEE